MKEHFYVFFIEGTSVIVVEDTNRRGVNKSSAQTKRAIPTQIAQYKERTKDARTDSSVAFFKYK